MAETVYPFYEEHRGAMEAARHHRLDLAEAMLSERAHLTDIDRIRQEVMDEFEIVLTQMPYVGGAASRMSDFFMRLMGFMAISRVLRRHGVSLSVIGEIERETDTAQLFTVPAAERRAWGVNSCRRKTRLCCASRLQKSRRQEFPEDFVYDFVEPGPADNFEFGINYTACGIRKFAARHGDTEILPNICGLDFNAYATQGILLERTQTLAGGAKISGSRGSRRTSCPRCELRRTSRRCRSSPARPCGGSPRRDGFRVPINAR
jgi:hypothetical protein